MMEHLLIEIGTEDLPPLWVNSAIEQLRSNFLAGLIDSHIEYSEVKTYATHRRLSILLKVSMVQKAIKKEIKGPPKTIGLDANGKFTKAAISFANQNNVSVESLLIKPTEKGEYFFAITEGEPQQSQVLLPDIIKKSILNITFPKMMKWGEGNIKFARPIRWIVAVLGEMVLNFSLESVKAEKFSRPHRLNKYKFVTIDPIANYESILKDNFVYPQPQERKEIILSGIKKLEKEISNAQVIVDDNLLEEIIYSVEFPNVFKGKFSKEYTDLPDKLIKVVIQQSLKGFIVISKKTGEILPFFIAVADYPFNEIESIKRENEKLVKSKFMDASFFLQESKKISLEERFEMLDKILFQENLGTLKDKTKRLMILCERIEKNITLEDFTVNDFVLLKRAAMLCKTDLTTTIVKEFTSLQGFIGGYFSKLQGEKNAVSEAIAQHYLPVQVDDPVPVSLIGSLLSIIDKLDNIIGFFISGYSPTGSEDLFGLKRQTIAILKVCKIKNLNIDLMVLFNLGIKVYQDMGITFKIPFNELTDNLKRFIYNRVENFLEMEGIRYDIVNALLGTRKLIVNELISDGIYLGKIYDDKDFEELVINATRVKNILIKSASREDITCEINPELFERDEENILFENFLKLKSIFSSKNLSINDKFKNLLILTPYIKRFFDAVLIMSDDLGKRKNRLALVYGIDSLCSQICDFTKIAK